MIARPPRGEPRSRKRKTDDSAGPGSRRWRYAADFRHGDSIEDLESATRKVTWPSDLEQGASGTGRRHHREQSSKKSSMRASPTKDQAVKAMGSSRREVEMCISGQGDSEHEPTESIVMLHGAKPSFSKAATVHHVTATLPIADVDFATASDQVKDELLGKGIRDLVEMVITFAKDIPQIPKERKRSFFDSLLNNQENKELIRYLGRLAIGDDQGEAAWVELLTDHDTRKALVLGILGQALKEHVLGSLYFGGSQNVLSELEQSQREKAASDGFERTRNRAEIVRSQAETDRGLLDVECRQTSRQVWEMLKPFWNVDRDPKITVGMVKRLRAIIEHAAKLNHKTREADDVVYYFQSTYKDEEFVPARMEALNIEDMIENSPYTKSIGAYGDLRADIVKGQEHRSEAIVRIVCFPGLVAYRQFGGELARQELEADKRHGSHLPETVKGKHKADAGDEDPTEVGFRSKVICKSVVFLKWGRQRLLTREAGTSAHIDAVRDGKMQKYEDDYKNFVELYDLFLSKHPGLVSRVASQKA